MNAAIPLIATGLEALVKAYLELHDDKVAAAATLHDMIAAATKAPELLVTTEAADDKAAETALDDKFPAGE